MANPSERRVPIGGMFALGLGKSLAVWALLTAIPHLREYGEPAIGEYWNPASEATVRRVTAELLAVLLSWSVLSTLHRRAIVGMVAEGRAGLRNALVARSFGVALLLGVADLALGLTLAALLDMISVRDDFVLSGAFLVAWAVARMSRDALGDRRSPARHTVEAGWATSRHAMLGDVALRTALVLAAIFVVHVAQDAGRATGIVIWALGDPIFVTLDGWLDARRLRRLLSVLAPDRIPVGPLDGLNLSCSWMVQTRPWRRCIVGG